MEWRCRRWRQKDRSARSLYCVPNIWELFWHQHGQSASQSKLGRMCAFRVTFNFHLCSLQIVNLTHPIYSSEDTRYDHPHVRDGNACLGNVAEHIRQLLAEKNLPLLVSLTLDFLRSYNSSNPHWNL